VSTPRTARRKLVTIETAAEHLKVAPRSIRRYIALGKLTGYRVAGATLIRVDLADVDALAKPIPAASGSTT
jgi:excisionase family DNA binding protein